MPQGLTTVCGAFTSRRHCAWRVVVLSYLRQHDMTVGLGEIRCVEK